ncbi:MAG: hypothetical protein C0412_13585 [Flavobacterium sp.]|nr:hypothetical protein [Flavobacterium sp.]
MKKVLKKTIKGVFMKERHYFCYHNEKEMGKARHHGYLFHTNAKGLAKSDGGRIWIIVGSETHAPKKEFFLFSTFIVDQIYSFPEIEKPGRGRNELYILIGEKGKYLLPEPVRLNNEKWFTDYQKNVWSKKRYGPHEIKNPQIINELARMAR